MRNNLNNLKPSAKRKVNSYPLEGGNFIVEFLLIQVINVLKILNFRSYAPG